MGTAISFIERMLFYCLLFTAAGQIPFQNKNIERHYHEFVNSSGFQDFFWTLASPVTWTATKTASMLGIKIRDKVEEEIDESLAR